MCLLVGLWAYTQIILSVYQHFMLFITIAVNWRLQARHLGEVLALVFTYVSNVPFFEKVNLRLV